MLNNNNKKKKEKKRGGWYQRNSQTHNLNTNCSAMTKKKRKTTKRQTPLYKLQHGKLKSEEHEPRQNPTVISAASEGWSAKLSVHSIIQQQVEKCDAVISTRTSVCYLDHCDIIISIAYLFDVICILLLISSIELNAGLYPAWSLCSIVSCSNCNLDDVFLLNAVFCMHFNIQSIAPKLELSAADCFAAKYSCVPIAWFSPPVYKKAIILSGFTTPFRRDELHRTGEVL